MVNIPRRCSVTGAGLSVTKAGLHTHIPPNATKRDGKNKTISCVKTYKTDRLGTTYRLLETKHEKEQKPLVLSHNPEVGGSSPPPATRNPLESCDSSGLFLFSATFSRGLFWVSESDPDSDPYGNFSGLERAINCRRGRVPWPPPPAAEPRWSRGRRYPR